MAVPSEIRLATEIAAQFRHQPAEEAAEAIAAHIRRFWDPRMRARLINQVTQAPEDCDAHVAAAVGVLEQRPIKGVGRVTARRSILRIREGQRSRLPDSLAAEEPLEIRVGGRALTVTMRTPGHDFDLAAGFLVSEGVVASTDHVAAIRYCAGAAPFGVNTYNIVDVILVTGVRAPDASLERNFFTTSACGLCGKASLEAVRTSARWSVNDDPLSIAPDTLTALPERLRSAQRLFDSTGGLHAAGLFTADGELLALREDVGRHNAVDKVVGHALRSGLLPLRETILMVSGRASFELVQKALMAGIPMLAAVSAPSSLAVDLAAENGLTLVGFLRGSSMNVYAGSERLQNHAERADVARVRW